MTRSTSQSGASERAAQEGLRLGWMRIGSAGAQFRHKLVCGRCHPEESAKVELVRRAQVTEHDQPDALLGRQVAAVVNVPPRQMDEFRSEVLTLGFADEAGAVVLFKPDHPVPNGSRLF